MFGLTIENPPYVLIAILCWGIPGLYLASLRPRLVTRGWVQNLLICTLTILSIVGLVIAYGHAFSTRSLVIAIAFLVPTIHFGLIEVAVRGFKRIAEREPDIAFRGYGAMADRLFSLGVIAVSVATIVLVALLRPHDA